MFKAHYKVRNVKCSVVALLSIFLLKTFPLNLLRFQNQKMLVIYFSTNLPVLFAEATASSIYFIFQLFFLSPRLDLIGLFFNLAFAAVPM